MNQTNVSENLIAFLKKLGYSYNSEAMMYIQECDEWYKNITTDFHKRKTLTNVSYELSSLNFAKRCCGDDANLCEIVEINGGENEAQFNFINEVLEDNRFEVMYRKQLEKMSALGTVGAYVLIQNGDLMTDGTIQGGDIRINYCDADCIIPLTVINDEVIECAFFGYNLNRGQKRQILVVFTKNEGKYKCDTYYFNDKGSVTDDSMSVQLGEVKPFAIMRTAESNNIENMDGYGYPKLYSAIPVLKVLDLAFNVLYSDLDKGEKITLVNEMLCEFDKDTGKPMLSNEQKKMFMIMSQKLSGDAVFVKEINPEIRIDVIDNVFETCLSLLSMSFGYGTKKYTFENHQIQTATQYIGERQDAMQELNKQRSEAETYITDICRAIMWFSNTFKKTTWNVDEDICIEFDDSYITDRQTELETLRADAISFPQVPEFLIQYVMTRLNCEREEAEKYIQADTYDSEDIDDVED